MEKIDFRNNDVPALNATNLNKLQDNIEDAIEEVQDNADTKLPLNSVKTTETNSDTNTYSCNYINDIIQDVYSTSEVKTNKVWIDGKPIYRMVVTNLTPTGTTGQRIYTATNVDIDNMTDYYGFYDSGGTYKQRKKINFWFSASDYMTLNYEGQYKRFYMDSSSGYTTTNSVTIIFEYTKTTD